ncbi:MAG: HDOD domain-containing protein, partial [Burkholderiaceae bacterium]
MSSVDRYFSGSVNLPVMPEVASLLIRTFGDDNASLDDLAQVLRKDPALVAKVLRLANCHVPGEAPRMMEDTGG